MENFMGDFVEFRSEFYDVFNKNISNIKKLTQISIDDDDTAKVMNRLLYANIITAMETYLSDALIDTTFSSGELINNFSNSNEETVKRKISIYDALKGEKYILAIVNEDMRNILYHNIPKVKKIYKFTLDIDFHQEAEKLMKFVDVRHDIVHRNGKNKEKKEIEISKEDIDDVINKVVEFITDLDSKLTFIVTNKSEEEIMESKTKQVEKVKG
ncbi:HEPN domain-containing protein [Clostridium sp. C8-1-8]|uniref:HEPN domain-containing protein n=1 Tax=Clostridium sp. C8-1-8 TaxID=2698831 RepID=UPI00136FD122|nr:HEPN domain-containing protein [Clostridium sp. C8-1-8]